MHVRAPTLAHPAPSPPFRAAGIGKKERRIYRGTMASGQGKSECSLTVRRILILVTHTYRRPEVENEWRKRPCLPFFLSFPTRTRFVSSHRKDHQHFQDYLEEKLCLVRKKWTVDIDETVIVRFFTSELRENVVQLRDTVL